MGRISGARKSRGRSGEPGRKNSEIRKTEMHGKREVFVDRAEVKTYQNRAAIWSLKNNLQTMLAAKPTLLNRC
jgi:hypothetical protein